MYAIFKRELFSFLSSMVAFIIIGIFLLASGILLWFFPETSILDYGYAELTSFFSLAPFLFMFLIPAVCMRTFAEERKEGTYILLATKPISIWEIIFSKYLACVVLLLLSLVPTLFYCFSIYKLGLPVGNMDGGATIGSYIGLFLLGAVYISIGVFASSLTGNQIVAFAIAVFLTFVFYTGFDSLSKITEFQNIEVAIAGIGINAHYQSISRGVIDARDLAYFLTVIFIFLSLTRIVIGGRKW
ncbi:MAG: gliding motility-associated ABC transporter permease subunit GldF [Pedobacter sp.]|nr:MAG: gliding motility-associated ABC transporter permease subunit GldF [Pedobacter sp.]